MNPPEVERTYRVFGHVLNTAHRFPTPLAGGRGPADLSFSLVERLPAEAEEVTQMTFDQELPNSSRGRLQLIHSPGVDILRRTDAIDFYLLEKRIEARFLDRDRFCLLDIGFFGLALPLWVQRRGWLMLHGSAVRIGDRAVGFLASQRGGKSSLAAAAMAAGYPLLSDDLLAVEPLSDGTWRAHGSFPQQRFWPSDAQRVVGSISSLERSHPSIAKLRVPVSSSSRGGYEGAGVPLSAIFLPSHDGSLNHLDQTEIRPVGARESVMNLLSGSSFPAIAEAAGLRGQRFDLATRLAMAVPVKTLRYPAGFEYLPGVVFRVARDIEKS